jgi:hypothetical protein
VAVFTGSSPALSACLVLFLSIATNVHSRHNIHSQTARLRHNALHHALKRRTAQPGLGVLDLRNLPNVLQADFAHRPLVCISRRRAVIERRLAFGISTESAVRACYVACAADFVLGRFDAGCGEE